MKDIGTMYNETFTAYSDGFKRSMRLGLLIYLLPLLIIGAARIFLENGLAAQFAALGEDVTMEQIITLFQANAATIGLLALLIIATMLISLLFTLSILIMWKEQGKRLSAKESVEKATSYLGRGIGLSIVMTIFLVGLFLLFIVPGIIFTVYWMFAFYALVLNEKGVLDALAESRKRVTGRWWRTLGHYALLTLLIGAIAGSVGLVIGLIGALIGIVAPFTGDMLIYAVSTAAQLLIIPFMITYMAILYKSMDERQNREGQRSVMAREKATKRETTSQKARKNP